MSEEQPTKMVERVARALAALQIRVVNRWEKPPPTDEKVAAGVEYAWPDFVPQARAAIEAMREPTQLMLDASATAIVKEARRQDFAIYFHEMAEGWRAGIDAALSEPS